MAVRGQTAGFSIGSEPPTIAWTVVRGDTAGFRIYVTDDQKVPLVIEDWNIAMDIKRPVSGSEPELVVSLNPGVTLEDTEGTFTVELSSAQSDLLLTGDVFDIELSDPTRVWTIARGSMIVIKDVTN